MSEETPEEKLRVVIVDDHALFREGLASILKAEETFDVIGQGGSATDAVRLVRELAPDIVLLDIDMPGSGLSAARAISESFPVTRIVVLTGSEEDDHLISALKSGAHAYILKGVAARELVRILQSVAGGESYVPPALAAGLLLEMHEAGAHSSKPQDNPMKDLTERELEILQGIAAGQTNREIAQQLFLSEKTVKHYITNILQKLHVRNRVEAALLAQKRADYTPGSP